MLRRGAWYPGAIFEHGVAEGRRTWMSVDYFAFMGANMIQCGEV